jgi:hypothetical protein
LPGTSQKVVQEIRDEFHTCREKMFVVKISTVLKIKKLPQPKSHVNVQQNIGGQRIIIGTYIYLSTRREELEHE